jgi:integrase
MLHAGTTFGVVKKSVVENWPRITSDRNGQTPASPFGPFHPDRPLHRRASSIALASPYRDLGNSFVDLDQGIYYRLAIGRRATNKRQSPAPIPSRLLAHMRRWVRRGFVTSHFVEWQGAPVKSVKTGFRHAVKLAGLWGKVTLHTLRHTAATWLMQRGVPIWQAAGYLGMSAQMIERTYGHHHP